MRKINLSHKMRPLAGATFALLLLGAGSSALADPVVSTVPWVATNPLIPHDIFNGESTRLKGTASDTDAGTLEYTWDYGDASLVTTANVSNQYVVEASHTYSGSTGTIFTATLTVQNLTTGKTDSANYFVQIQDKNLDTEANVAIDEGLWYLHKTMTRFLSGSESCGYWNSGAAGSGYVPNWAVNANAFFVNGHLQNGAVSNPYTETVQRAMCYLPTRLVTRNIGTITFPAPVGGPHDPDGNGNGIALYVNQTSYGYTLGAVIDAFVASGEPNRVVTTGGTNVIGRTYKEIVQDMADWYMASMTYNGTYWGGWDYNGFSFSRNDFSVAQWGAIGLIAAEQSFGITIPQWVKDANAHGVRAMQTAAGGFGYDRIGYYPWGEWAVNPSGMVQAALDGIGRGDPAWDNGESHIRDAFCNNPGSPYNTVLGYYYGLFSFTKSMLLHNVGGVIQPITLLQSSTAGVTPIDWYEAEVSKGAACDGVARRLVNTQNTAGYWTGYNVSGTQNSFDTAWAIIMLNRTVFASGLPVAVAQATPNPGVVGQTIQLDGSSSFHQDSAKSIDSWEWDLDNDGTYDVSGPVVSTSFATLADHPVTLRVTDNASPEESDTTVITVRITTPPIAPTADADGPYVFCPQAQPWFLDGTGSVNPDEGLSEIGQPGDTIQSYAWDLDGNGVFNDALGVLPDVTAYFTAQGVGSYLVQLKVTDTTATSFPSSGSPDLSDTDSAQISVKDAADTACACIDNLAARAKSGKVQLTWTDTGADHYNVYRSNTSGGPFSLVAPTTSTYSTYLDTGLTNGTTYYYVVREAALNGDELCQSNEASATPVARVRRR